MADSLQQEHKKQRGIRNDATASSVVYGMGFLGALTYYIVHATTFWEGVFGVFKALIWPAMLVYKLLEFLKM